MSHALIIDDDVVISRAIANRLMSHGFNTFDLAQAESQAAEAAELHKPDLVVVSDSVTDGLPHDVAHHIATSCGAPVLMVTSGRVRRERWVPDGLGIRGPFHVTRLDAALTAGHLAGGEIEPCV